MVSEPGEGARKIFCGPLYLADEVLQLLSAKDAQNIRAWTGRCGAEIQKLALDGDDLVVLLRQAITVGQYLGSEWCQQRPGGPWAACDAYRLVRQEWMVAARREMPFEYYLKFAIAKTGALLLLVSCHLST